MTKEGLANLFSQVATVSNAYIRQNAGFSQDKGFNYGFVSVSSVRDVENAIANMNGHRIKNFNLRVSVARETPNERQRAGAGGDAHSVNGDHRLPSQHSKESHSTTNRGSTNGDALGSYGPIPRNGPVGHAAPPLKSEMPAMGGLINARCEECQRLWIELFSHVQKCHTEGSPSKTPTGNNLGNGNLDSDRDATSVVKSPASVQSQRKASPSPRKPQSPSGERNQAKSPQGFQQSVKGSAFSRPNPKNNKSPLQQAVPKDQGARETTNSTGAAASPARESSPDKKKTPLEPKPCEACGKKGTKHCSKCHVTYCSVQCQKGDWKRHKNSCKPNQPSEQNDAGTSSGAARFESSELKYVTPPDRELRVLLTHAISPGSFWLQLAEKDNVNQYTGMVHQINAQVEKSDPIENPKLGMVCIAKFVEDGGWYRSVVQNCNGHGTVMVSMVDFGNTETVSVQDLRPVTAEIMKVPVQGVHCAIGGIEPRGTTGKWSPDSTKLLESTCSDQSVVLMAKFVGVNANVHQVELKTVKPQGGAVIQNIGEVFIQKEMAWARSSGPSKETPRKVLMMSSMKRVELPLNGTPVLIAINNYVDPRRITCQMLKHEDQLELDKFSKELNKCLEGQPKQQKFSPTVGEVCAGRFSDDNTWYRAHVRAQKPDGGYLVEYIDYGNGEVISSSRMCPLPLQFHSFPRQSFLASFADLPPGDISRELSKATVEHLQQHPNGFKAVFTDCNDTTVFMNLTDAETGKDIAEAIGLVSWVKTYKMSDASFVTIPPNTDQTLVVNEIKSPGEFYGMLANTENHENMIQINGQLEMIGSQPLVPNFKPRKGDLCCAQFSADNTWYRAVILSEHPDKEYDVQYVDFGNGEKVPVSRMRPMTEELAAFPINGIKCCLAGLPDYKGPWDDEVTSSLKEMAGVGHKGLIVRAIEHRNSITYVELEDSSTGLNISQEIINLIKESSSCPSEAAPSGPSSLSSNPARKSLQQQQPSTPTPAQQPRSAPATMISPEKIQSLEEQLAMLQAQLQAVKGNSS